MADSDPTGDNATVVLTITADHARFLRTLFEAARAGVRDELGAEPGRWRDPAVLRREEAVYGRLLVALETCLIAPDLDLRDVLADLARTLDADNEYERVAAEHAALGCLLHQLGVSVV